MLPEHPWNVAGIAPEAREAARTSARREGLSVGEWLTRRILRGLGETDAANEDWWLADVPHAAGESRTSLRQSGDGLARAQRADYGSKGSQVRNERDLSRLAARLGQRHRGRNEDKHTPNEAAVPFEMAARERAVQTVEQLTARIVQLDARLVQIERTTVASGTSQNQSMKALQERIATLAEEVGQTATRSSAQAAQLAAAVEAVANKFIRARGEASGQDQILEERIAALAASIDSVSNDFHEHREDTDRHLRGVEDRLTAMELSVAELGADKAGAARLGESLDHLTRRFEEAEAEHAHTVTRVEQRVDRIETGGAETIIDRRLQGIERALADMSEGMEKGARERMNAAESVHAELRNLAFRIESAEQRHATALAEKSPVRSRDAAPDGPPLDDGAAGPILDLPPFPEKPEAHFAAPQPLVEPGVLSANDLRGSLPDSGAEHGEVAQGLRTTTGDSSLAAARRNVSEANRPPTPRDGPFSWLDPAEPIQANENANTNTRHVLLGTIGLLVLTAVGAGFYLSTMFFQPRPLPQPTQIAPSHFVAVIRPNPQSLAPTQRPRKTVSVAAAKTGTTTVPVAPMPVIAYKSEAAPGAPASRTATSQAKPITPQARLATLAGAGSAKAEEVLGLEYLDGDGVPVNEAEGAKWLARAAEQGEAVAAYRLGTLYERGRGVAADRKMAVRWYAAAAQAGNRKAMHNLAVSYAQGAGVPKDSALAAQWFLRAANLGLADSQFDLAVLYERGLGVRQSVADAYKWYAIAAAQGDAESKARIEAIASQIGTADKAAAEKAVAAFQPAPLERTANAPPIAASLVGG